MTVNPPAPLPKPLWPANAWYVAARAEEISDKPLGRQICGARMVFFRGPDGAICALEDFCPHRGAPLSLGFVRDGELVCGYHGLTVGCTGRVASMPGQKIGGFPPLRHYPAVERHGFIWVWPGEMKQGEEALADPATIPHLAWAKSPEWAYGGGMFHVKCDYRLMIDNLMDLTHETYVHAGSIGQKEIDETPVKTRREGDEIITSRFMEGILPPPFWQMALRSAGLPDDRPVDRWQICRFSLPSHVMIEVGVALAGQGGYDAPETTKVSSVVVDFITPETETSNHYFWGMARRFNVVDAGLTEAIRAGQATIFGEDLEMLERQQLNFSAWPDRKLLLLNIDAGGARARQMIEAAIG